MVFDIAALKLFQVFKASDLPGGQLVDKVAPGGFGCDGHGCAFLLRRLTVAPGTDNLGGRSAIACVPADAAAAGAASRVDVVRVGVGGVGDSGHVMDASRLSPLVQDIQPYDARCRTAFMQVRHSAKSPLVRDYLD
ncbi:hypothetical protein MHPYR_70173 [uncultured Mycobacterium sp.]|uniref:Uncharacterized protein n=1 Tax=uncultured Mycobacterium sp. TaxID=171292 RepID=A0A1Y5PKN5_9MYCO|nr:hypothetical protein MHPYR_70173 [uncultured Mycobacterium sp.]